MAYHEQHASSQHVRLTDLPQEIVLLIFSHLNLGTSVLLSLTCKHLRRTFTSLHPNTKISLLEPCYTPPGWRNRQLVDLLETWIGPKYRRRKWSYSDMYHGSPSTKPPQYLLRAVYGDSPGSSYIPRPPPSEGVKKEQVLVDRYSDYHHYFRTNPETGEKERILPNPFNAGDAWHVAAKKAVIADAQTRGSWEEWMLAWRKSCLFHGGSCMGLTYREKLEVLRDLERKGREGWWETGWVGEVRGWVRLLKRRCYMSMRWGRKRVDTMPWPPSREIGIVGRAA
jgi:hypothetical protein